MKIDVSFIPVAISSNDYNGNTYWSVTASDGAYTSKLRVSSELASVLKELLFTSVCCTGELRSYTREGKQSLSLVLDNIISERG